MTMTTSPCLGPPGSGVFTVNTAQDIKYQLYRTLYGFTDERVVREKWEGSLASQLPAHRGSVVLGIASDCGGGIQRGANWGPLFIRNRLYSENGTPGFFDLGDVRVIPHLLMDKYLNDQTIATCRKALYGTENIALPVSPLSMAMAVAEEFYRRFDDKGLIGLGGDHSTSFPLARSFFRARRAMGREVALIHFDAHTDLMDSRLGIDICFGSWVYHILAELTSSGHVYQVGLRSSAHDEHYWEKKLEVQQFWSQEVKERGPEDIAQEMIDDLKLKGVEELYISIDIDVIDSSYASATGTPEPDGLEPHQVMVIVKKLSEQFAIGAGDVMEVAPFVSRPGRGHRRAEPESTLGVAQSLVKLLIAAVNSTHRG